MRKQTKLVAVMSAAALLAIGASMTSFAATRGWVEENGVWMYLDSDGDAVSEEWKKSGTQYFWLDENGEMATDALVEDDDDKYYVDANGARVINQWKQVDNEDGLTNQDDDEEPEQVWYYFGSNGKAVKGKKTINGKTYFFDDDDYHMYYGWYKVDNGDSKKDKYYYLGEENEGWAFTGWQWLELRSEIEDDEKYEDDEYWFHFKSSGEMRRSTKDNDEDNNVYINGAYYGFDINGVMVSGWRPAPVDSGEATATANKFYTDETGNIVKGWNFTYEYKDWDDQNEDQQWYYLDSKGRPFNIGGVYQEGNNPKTTNSSAMKYKEGKPDKGYNNTALKIIKKKTYLFDGTGMMLTGVYQLTGDDLVVDSAGIIRGYTPRVGGAKLEDGYYYFNKNDGSMNGQMEKGKVTVNYDGESYYYHFDKTTGKAYTNAIKDGCLYDTFGVRVDSDDSKEFFELSRGEFDGLIEVKDGNSKITLDPATDAVIVSTSGKLKKSGKVTIEGDKYVVKDYKAELDTSN